MISVLFRSPSIVYFKDTIIFSLTNLNHKEENGSTQKRVDTTLPLQNYRRCIYHSMTNLFKKVLNLCTVYN